MKIERYIGVMVVLVVGLFLVNASGPQPAFAAAEASTATNCVPANAWCTPATSGGVSGTFCATEPVRPARTAARSSDGLLDVVGSIVAAPFVLTECLLVGCP
ncbi:MAG: hypothetical protein HY913_12965 [Desulfomonile tiedjei]|nr:hypothetical protein [Desulfomonile tiedjei]